ncbi:MAG TPA: hypothetical protein VGO34_03630 [Alphaproteobacteria bacterium]|jgi:hypothetical protein
MNTKVRQESDDEMNVAAEVAAAATGVRLKDRFQIWPDAPLNHLDSPLSSAYAVTDAVSGNENFFALVGSGDLMCRDDVMVLLQDVRSTSVMRLVEWGYVWWPRDNRRRLITVYERPGGARLMADLASPVQPMSELQSIRSLLAPAISALSYLSVIGVVHRAIRPTNLFYSDGTRQSIVLGECVMSPPGYFQPTLFETIESSMSHPAGRGNGTRGNDIYSLGVTLLYLLLGRNPVPQLSDKELLAAKLAQGSFTTLVARAPIPTAMREPLRGMLQDDPAQRWDLADLQAWVSERRLKPVQVLHNERAMRPLNFEGQNYYTCRSLASALTHNWRSGSMNDRKVELSSWIERSLGDNHRREGVERAYDNRFSGAGAAGESSARAMLNARLVLALDPDGPLRYKTMSAMVDGIGPYLATHFNDASALQDFNEVVRGGLPIFWLDMLRHSDREANSLVIQFRKLNGFLRDPRPGFGFERCLYELNQGQHCLSPLVERETVITIGELLPALEKVSRGMTEGVPFDRHLAAFIAARSEGDLSQALAMVANRNSPMEAAMGLLSLYAALQWRHGPESLPELTRWVMISAEPLLGNYHHRSARKRAEAELPRVMNAGSIVGLYNFLLNGDLRKQDEAGFAEAAVAYSKAETEIAFIESGGASNPRRARELGYRIAALFSLAVGLSAMALLTLARF